MKKVIIGVLIILMTSMAFIACEPAPLGETKILYTVAPVNVDGTTTSLTFTFTDDVTDILDVSDITVSGGSTPGVSGVSKGNLVLDQSSSGQVWTLGISGQTAAGNVTVYITNDEIESTSKTVALSYPSALTLALGQDGHDAKKTTYISLTFSSPVTITIDDVTLTSEIGAAKGSFSSNEARNIYTLFIKDFTETGNVTVSIESDDYTGSQSIKVWFVEDQESEWAHALADLEDAGITTEIIEPDGLEFFSHLYVPGVAIILVWSGADGDDFEAYLTAWSTTEDNISPSIRAPVSPARTSVEFAIDGKEAYIQLFTDSGNLVDTEFDVEAGSLALAIYL